MVAKTEPIQTKIASIGLLLGPAVAAFILLVGPPENMLNQTGQIPGAWVTLALLLLMAIWWVTEAVPIPVTSLLPLVVLPLFGVSSISEVAAPYMHPIVVLLMGGFIFAKAIENCGLHERIALQVVKRAGGSLVGLIGGFMLAAALLSMWISNTATCIMMMPIALSVAAAIENGSEGANHQFTYALLLSIAYACSIGGLGTPIGTPTNLIVMGYLNEQSNHTVSFSQWMMIGLPAVALMLPLAWFTLTKWAFKMPDLKSDAARSEVSSRLLKLGEMNQYEWRTLSVFIVIASLWVFRRAINDIELQFGNGPVLPFAGLTDHSIAIIAVILCFVIPAGNADSQKGQKLLNWSIAEQIPWGVLLLFGGGMSLASAISSTGLSAYIGGGLAVVATYPIPLLILIIAVAVLALTEVTSNVATASALMPVLVALAVETSLPLEVMAAPLALAASCAFMLPMATGPNAVVFASGKVSLITMARAGFRLNLMAVIVIALVSYAIAPMALGG